MPSEPMSGKKNHTVNRQAHRVVFSTFEHGRVICYNAVTRVI
jgi:hypothetical protein